MPPADPFPAGVIPPTRVNLARPGRQPIPKPPLCKGRWLAFRRDGRIVPCLSAQATHSFIYLAVPLRGTGWGSAPHTAVPLLTQKRNQKTATRSLWSNPFDCPFSWRRSQSGSLRSHGSAHSLLGQRTAPFTRPEKRQGDLTSFATVACGEPLGCAPFSLQPRLRVVAAGRLQKQTHTIGCSTLHTSQENTPLSRLPPPGGGQPRRLPCQRELPP